VGTPTMVLYAVVGFARLKMLSGVPLGAAEWLAWRCTIRLPRRRAGESPASSGRAARRAPEAELDAAWTAGRR